MTKINLQLPEWLVDFASKDISEIKKENELDKIESMRRGLEEVEDKLKELSARTGLANLVEASDEKIHGGYGDNIEDDQFCPIQLEKGIMVEKEHTSDPDEAKEIAKDHLMEHPQYYNYLEDMENNMGGSKEDIVTVVPMEPSPVQVQEPSDISLIPLDIMPTQEPMRSVVKPVVKVMLEFANYLDQNGQTKEARAFDKLLNVIVKSAKDKEKEESKLKEEIDKLTSIIDNILRARGGHISTPALLEMILEQVSPNTKINQKDLKEVRELLKEKIDNCKVPVKEEVPYTAVLFTVTDEDLAENNKMFQDS